MPEVDSEWLVNRRRATIVVEWTSGPWDAYVQRMVERHADQMMQNLVNQGVAPHVHWCSE